MDLSALMYRMGYRFNRRSLIEEALRHSSYVNEQPESGLRDNERLEFLGDAVLNLIVGHLLMERFPDLNEGDLSRMRANLVNESQLADVARAINLGPHIKLGKGEMLSNGFEKPSILANTFEAVVAAVYLDGGFTPAFETVQTHLASIFDELNNQNDNQDFKSQLQELVQSLRHNAPVYTIVEESGPDHDKTFTVHLDVIEIKAEGRGKSKKSAEQDAARQALEMLRGPQKSALTETPR